MPVDPPFRAWLLQMLDFAASRADPQEALSAFGAACGELSRRGMAWSAALAAPDAEGRPAVEIVEDDLLPASPTIPAGPASPAAAAARILHFVTSIEALEEDKASLAEDIKGKYAEAKGEGFDTTTLRKVIALRRKDPRKLREEEELLELYMSALESAPPSARLPSKPGHTLIAVAGSDDEVGDRLAEVEGIVDSALAHGSLTSWEEDFCTDLKAKLEEYGERAYVTQAMWEVLERLEGRAER